MQNQVPDSPPGQSAEGRPSRFGRLRALVVANKLFTLVLAAGAVLRLITVLGYPGALWFAGDSYVYLGAALRLRPDLSKSTGYSLFLKVLEPFHSLTLVTIVQHLMGLVIAVLLYVLLRRARVPKLWATLATVPVLLNGFQIELEHMIMADTLFMFLLVVAATILLWRRRPSWPAVLVAGLLTGYAVTVWSGGLILPVVFFVFVIVRRMGWRALAAIVAGCAVPIVGYAAWFHSWSGTFALTQSEGFYLYGRVSSFANCATINPPASERYLCLSTPVTKREPPGALVWHIPQVHEVPGGPVSAAGNKALRDFAVQAIEAQPVSYAHAIVDGLVLSVDWKRYNYPSKGTVYDYYFHTKAQAVPDHSWIPGATAPQDIQSYGHQGISRVVRPFAYLMSGYERVFYLYGPLFGLILVLGLGIHHPGDPAPRRRVPAGAMARRAERDAERPALGVCRGAAGVPDRGGRLRLPVCSAGHPLRLPGRWPGLRVPGVPDGPVGPLTGRRRGGPAVSWRGSGDGRPRVIRSWRRGTRQRRRTPPARKVPPVTQAPSSGSRRGRPGLRAGEETPRHLPGNVGGVR